MWVPAVPLEGRNIPYRVVILEFGALDNEADLVEAAGKTTFTGMVVSRASSLSKRQRELLEEGLRRVDLDETYLLDVGGRPDTSFALGALAVAVALLAVGAFLARGPGRWLWD